MSLRQSLRDDPRTTLFDQIDATSTSMLGIEGSTRPPQPMTHHLTRDTAELWFLTSRQADLVRDVGLGARGVVVFVNDDHSLHAALTGAIVQSADAGHIDAIWSPAAAAWFPGGRDDPDLIALRLTLQDAQVWVSSRSSLRTGMELLRSALDSDHEPDLSTHMLLEFNG